MDTQAIVRQRHQKGLSKMKSRMMYLRTRGKAKMEARKRYRVVRNRPTFKRRQRVRKKKPWLFKRKHAIEDQNAQALTPANIAFVHPDTGNIVGVREVSPMSGLVTYLDKGTLGTIPFQDIMERGEFVTWEDIEKFYDLLDATFLTEEEEEFFDERDDGEEEEFGGPEDWEDEKLDEDSLVMAFLRR